MDEKEKDYRTKEDDEDRERRTNTIVQRRTTEIEQNPCEGEKLAKRQACQD